MIKAFQAFEYRKKGTSDPGKHHALLTLRKMGVVQREIEKGVKILQKGGVIAFPTDTVYGLGADAFNSTAVERIYEIKNRPKHRQLPLLIADVERLSALAEPIPEIAWFLARRFWPGGLTLVLPKTDSVPAYLASGPTIAVRVPNHPVCQALIQHLGNPIIGTSANISSQPAALTAEEVGQQLGEKIDLIINGGKCPGGKESTIVDITHELPIILRQGIIPSHEIDKAYKEYLEAK
ncbi:MAG: L-threonylcarbamoyladenylate synthase [Dehalococcoidia bacterium]|nr:L-threonylcarbamoyladenylate synthase [Dehalococcoidia bacterium]